MTDFGTKNVVLDTKDVWVEVTTLVPRRTEVSIFNQGISNDMATAVLLEVFFQDKDAVFTGPGVDDGGLILKLGESYTTSMKSNVGIWLRGKTANASAAIIEKG